MFQHFSAYTYILLENHLAAHPGCLAVQLCLSPKKEEPDFNPLGRHHAGHTDKKAGIMPAF
jgi:hypothetical protein